MSRGPCSVARHFWMGYSQSQKLPYSEKFYDHTQMLNRGSFVQRHKIADTQPAWKQKNLDVTFVNMV